jgi:hypothetical protein
VALQEGVESVKNSFSAKKVALGGILGALTIICLFLATTLPTNRISLYALSSFFVSIIVLEAGIGTAWLFYGASSILALLIIPNKVGVIPYIVFFGIYGVIKFYIEKIGRLVPEWIIKLLYFNICFFAAVHFMKELLNINVIANFPWWAVVLVFELIYIVYDYVYTLFIGYYKHKIRPKLKW